MNGRFRFYRRRRLLPFAAAWCLVCINGATLQPLAAPHESLDGATTAGADHDAAADAWKWLQYERRSGEDQSPAVAANVPPIVKNLRRPAPPKHAKAGARAHVQRPADGPTPNRHVLQHALAANAPDLMRLCRLLL